MKKSTLAMNLVTTLGAMLISSGINAQSQLPADYPSRPLTLIVPYTPGGTTDMVARLIANKLSESLGKPVVVENRPGGGATLGTGNVAKAPPDGYTLLLASSTPLVIAPLLGDAPYNPTKDFTPISLVADAPLVVYTNASLPLNSIQELISHSKNQSNGLNYATYGQASLAHLAGELFKNQTGAALNHVPYKGSSPAIMDVVAGHVPVGFDMLPAVLPQYKAGKVRVLAVTSKERSPQMPEVGTVSATLSGYEVSSWFGIVAPAGLPEPILRKLNQELVAIVARKDVQDSLASLSLKPVSSSSERFSEILQQDAKKWQQIIKNAAISK